MSQAKHLYVTSQLTHCVNILMRGFVLIDLDDIWHCGHHVYQSSQPL